MLKDIDENRDEISKEKIFTDSNSLLEYQTKMQKIITNNSKVSSLNTLKFLDEIDDMVLCLTIQRVTEMIDFERSYLKVSMFDQIFFIYNSESSIWNQVIYM